MVYGIKENILSLKKTSYAKEVFLDKEESEYIDCSNGINPLGVSEEVKKEFKNISSKMVNAYSKSSIDVRLAIVDYWSDVCKIDESQIALGDGSIEILYKINKLFIDNKSKILGYAPQFSDYVDDVKSYGTTYECTYMNIDNNYKFIAQEYMDLMKADYKLFYLDNPNNPTGQLIDIGDIREIVEKAKSLNRAIIIDEAYGDFIDNKNSAISLVNEFDNLMVLRTFSKGLGLAGLRAGYLVSSDVIIENYLKVTNPFEMNNIARHLTIFAMKDKDFMRDSSTKLRVYKRKFINSLEKLVVLETEMAVPIITLMHPDRDVDLEALLFKHDILSISGEGFAGLGKNFVRIMLIEDIDRLIDVFKKVEIEIQLKNRGRENGI